ncbi:MAG: SBBP repeat-containing protein [Gammaproteobacteria bacterium]|jgi:hypothetical protein|nr:SBBP repeat-containing protein [Gammaproteobacteria bacterium]
MYPRIRHLSLSYLLTTLLTAIPSAGCLLAATELQPEPMPGMTALPASTDLRQAAYAHLPAFFEPNLGQFDPRVQFASRADRVNVFLTDRGVVLVVNSGAPGKQRITRSVAITAVNGNRKAHISGLKELPGKVNYFYGKTPEHWHTEVPTYARVKYADIYPGIDLLFRGDGHQLEFDFVLEPGADPESITLAVTGQDVLRIDASGNTLLDLGEDNLRLHKPRIYQGSGAETRNIPGAFYLDSSGNLRFQVAAYDRSLPLVIDPVVSYSTYLGGGSTGDENMGTAIAVHPGGSAYITGYTTTANFPVTPGVFQPEDGTIASSTSNFDGFVARISADGKNLIYASYLAGEGQDIPLAIAVDSTGNAYVTGKTQSDDFPVSNGAYQVSNCGSCAFLTKISPDGTAIVFSTYLGTTLTEARGIAVDASSNAYLMGNTSSNSFPTTAGVLQQNRMGSFDAFVTKFNSTGTALLYSTLLGGTKSELLSSLTGDIAIDLQGNAYITGQTDSGDFPTVNALQPVFGSDQTQADAFVAKINPTASALLYSTYLGGSEDDAGQGIDIDDEGNAYVTGRTNSTDFPVNNALQPINAGGIGLFAEAFISKISADGSSLVYSTYLGGSGSDEAYGVQVNADHQAHIVGKSLSSDFPTLSPVEVQPVSSSAVFVSKLLADGSGFVYSTRFGGGVARGMDIALDGAGYAYIAGSTAADDFPVINAIQPGAGDASENAFITKLADPPTLPTTPVDLSGTVKAVDGTEICAMVLASGKFMFSCNPIGELLLTGLPREKNGTVKRQVYADGFFPKIDILTGSTSAAVFMTRSGACPSYNMPYDQAVVPGSAGKRINISGKVLLQNSQTPICAMVLANGQFMFTCDGTGSYALNIPLDSNGQFKLQVYADGFAPTIQVFDEFQTMNNVRMARAAECQ